MLFRVLFYVLHATGVAFFTIFAAVLFDAVFDFNPSPFAEAVFSAVIYLMIGGCIFSGLCAIYLAARKWRLACPRCGTTGDWMAEKSDVYVACPSCGDVGGGSFWDWSIKAFPPGNPTREWTRDSHVPLIVDLDQGSLCGVQIGEAITPLQPLGPVEYAPSLRLGDYSY